MGKIMVGEDKDVYANRNEGFIPTFIRHATNCRPNVHKSKKKKTQISELLHLEQRLGFGERTTELADRV